MSSKLLTSAEMREADRRTIEELGLPGAVLMENAGAGVEAALWQRLPDLAERRVLVLAGSGNNGGDGFVVARRLHLAGVRVSVFLLGHGNTLKGDARLNHDVFLRLGGEVQEFSGDEVNFHGFALALTHSGVVVVDAVFGTGLSKPVVGLPARLFELINQSGKPVMAVDLPSGVCADDGRVLECAIQAHWTVTFGAEKIAHRQHPGAGLCGEVIRVDIGIPPIFLDHPGHRVARNLPGDLRPPVRLAAGHKGCFGHLLVVAGSRGKAGAAVLAALGAQRTGPGLVTVASPLSVQQQTACQLTEAMTLPLPEDDEGQVAASALSLLQKGSWTTLAVGPGLGGGFGVIRLVEMVLTGFDLPVVVDADGLNVLAGRMDILVEAMKQRRAPVILTPHPGEMARLLAISTAEVLENRLECARRGAMAWGVWLVLKGAGTVIAAPDGRAWINETGNSGLAAGGSGDLLTGIVAGLLAQGWSVEQASRGGVWLHGAAADVVAGEGGSAGLMARDLLPHVQRLRNGL